MGSNKTIDMSETVETKKTKKLSKKSAQPEEVSESTEATEETVVVKKGRVRSKRYINLRGQVDRTTFYSPEAAVELLKRLSRKKQQTVTADIIHADDKVSVELSFPYSTGKSVRVAVADDTILAAIEKGQIDFDVLVASPDYMPKLARLAKILGPKGLMPNPKTGTLTKDTDKKKKELEAGRTSVRTEKKAPLIHVQIGRADMKAEELLANLSALVKVLNPVKVKKLVISSTMSPGIKIDLASYQIK